MADESQYTETTAATNKRKYDDQTPPSSRAARPTGFSSAPPDSSASSAPPSYNSVPPPPDDIQLAKQKAQEIAARLIASAGGPPAAPPPVPVSDFKRPRVDNGDDNKGFGSAPLAIPVSYGSYHGGTSKKIEIPNGRVGVIIGKGGETIKYLQLQSGAKIQVTRDMDSDPNAPVRSVELTGTPEQIDKAEKLINEVIAEADAGGSGGQSQRYSGQRGSEHFVLKVPNNKVGLVIGKGGETIKSIQTRTGARVQVVPLHLPPGDASSDRNVHIDGTYEQVEAAKQMVNEVISGENRVRNPTGAGGYNQQGYQNRPPTSWAPPGPPQMQQGYGYMQPQYPGAPSQYNMSQPQYAGYPPQPASGGYPSNWDQSGNHQVSQGYDYYSQPPPQQQQTSGGTGASADNASYNYNHTAASGYNQGFGQDGYGGYPQSAYGQPPSYDQHQGYGSAPNYGTQGSYGGAQGDMTQAPTQGQGYSSGQQPDQNASYPHQGTTQTGYGMPPTSQPGYGSQPPSQAAYSSSGYGTPQAQKPPTNPSSYGQSQQSPSASGGYGQPPASGYPQSQVPQSGHTQPDSGAQRAPPSSYGASPAQSGYGAPPYGSPQAGQTGYGQGPPAYGAAYGAGYSQPQAYSADANANTNARGTYDSAPASQSAQQAGAAKASPES